MCNIIEMHASLLVTEVIMLLRYFLLSERNFAYYFQDTTDQMTD